jgi:hypothetical protein
MVCDQRTTKGIRFNVRILTPGEPHELRKWELKLRGFLSDYGFDVAIEQWLLFAVLDGLACVDHAVRL